MSIADSIFGNNPSEYAQMRCGGGGGTPGVGGSIPGGISLGIGTGGMSSGASAPGSAPGSASAGPGSAPGSSAGTPGGTPPGEGGIIGSSETDAQAQQADMSRASILLAALTPISPIFGLMSLAIKGGQLLGAVPDLQGGVVGNQGGGPGDFSNLNKLKKSEVKAPVAPVAPVVPKPVLGGVDEEAAEEASENERRKALIRTGRAAMRKTNQFDLGSPFVYIPSLSKML